MAEKGRKRIRNQRLFPRKRKKSGHQEYKNFNKTESKKLKKKQKKKLKMVQQNSIFVHSYHLSVREKRKQLPIESSNAFHCRILRKLREERPELIRECIHDILKWPSAANTKENSYCP